MQGSLEYLEEILKNEIPVVIYNGSNDICMNSGATQTVLDKVKFIGQEEFRNLGLNPWKDVENDKIIGYTKKADKLTLYLIN